VKIKQASSLVVSLGKALKGMPLPLTGKKDSNRLKLNSKTAKVTSLSPGAVCRKLTSPFKMHALVSSLHTTPGQGNLANK